MKYGVRIAALAMLALAGGAFAQVDVEAFVKKDKFTDIKISPTGEYFAATIPQEDKTALAIIRRSDNSLAGSFALGRNTHVGSFDWVSDQRVLIGISEKYGQLDKPQPTGELYAINADGSGADLLVGYRVAGRGVGTRIQPKKVESVAAFLTDTLPGDDRGVVVSVWPMTGDDPFTRAERLDVVSGRRTVLARAPVRRASFATDNRGVVRFALGAGSDNVRKLYYRDGEAAAWTLIADEALHDRVEVPLGFSEDDRTAYIQVESERGPDAIVAMDIASGQRRQVLRDETADPLRIIYRNGTSIPVGAMVMAGKPRTLFFDDASPEARMYRSMEAAFGGEAVFITSSSKDGRLALIQTWSGGNPGDFFIFDTVAKKAEYLLSRREWFDPATMASVRPISLQARDGLQLHGYLTVPQGRDDGKLPMVVMPHGGPFGVFDTWGFDEEAQLLAAAGYAVLQVNFRGSGNYGRAFRQAGGRQWGGAMQDDVTDATRWAIEQGIADAGRICIYGASYGGYAALMGAAKEPDLYRCAAGYVGVYDLPMMFTTGDIQQRGSGENYLKQWLGERESLAAVSPVNLAARIKVPVFLAAGGKDERAPIQHSRRMQAALAKAGVPVETLYYDTEGHGFYTEPHQREYYTRLLDFLSRQLGGQVAKAGTP
ncbi:S9 family peptidase [Stenotrophomonas sp. MMGLT7]|uniref:alpha/beta hydrolase family protein n=1 Tax=Stenotrophomonas sp. MMGLT7 TaxID=2901227 RepID=UPI001E65384F|nr:S9 family peptidase [Stenotrophomonas sp. MMGLT7]MCD7100374.1 S9 family peptidase [Stenotrophomonas sp. MMGLT7]